MISVLIADDESIVLEGLKCILDWKELGFYIIGEAKNGEDALEKLNILQPDLALLDIRMPKLHGTDVIKMARQAGYKGHFIILSGYSDFKYAQTALHLGVDFYLTKPIDEDELTDAILEVKALIESEYHHKNAMLQYREKAKDSILTDLLNGSGNFHTLDLSDFYLTAPVYQVIIAEKYNQDVFPAVYNISDLLKSTRQDRQDPYIDSVMQDGRSITLLKGDFTLRRFENMLNHYKQTVQKGSPLDSLFITYGRPVYKLEDICQSYEDARKLMDRRFFCGNNQHILSFESMLDQIQCTYSIQSADALNLHQIFTDYIQSRNKRMIAETLHNLEYNLYYAKEDITTIKHYLTDIYLQIKQTISHIYHKTDIPFPTNTFVISLIENKYFLYDIIMFFSEQFEIIMNAIGHSTNENVLDDILYYIDHNYHENIKLENIAHLFGYNSGYLGKLFYKKSGGGYNTYLDQARIRESKKLLLNNDLKVYEVANQVGYKSVDYFHKKFKKYVGMSPAEYRKNKSD